MNKYQRAFVPTLIFFFTIILILFIRQLDSEDKVSMYKKLINYDMPAYWKILDIASHKNTTKKSGE
jgi:hypothetical protein